MLVRHFAGDGAWARSERGLREGTRALRDVLQEQASYVRGSFEAVATLLRQRIAVDPAFPAFVAEVRSRGYPVTVVSSGLEPIIAGRLAAIGLSDVPIVANGVDADPAGWSIRFRDDVANGTDKAAVVAEARRRGARTVFIGDGRSDFAAARAADVAFARRDLALHRYLDASAIAHRTFASFAEIVRALPAMFAEKHAGADAGGPADAGDPPSEIARPGRR